MPITGKTTAKDLKEALLRKIINGRTAILTEVTMVDEDASYLNRSAIVQERPWAKEWYDKNNQTYDETLPIPEGYDSQNVVLVRRIDALIFETVQKTAVEIKISRSDFFRDTLEKRAPWMRHTHRFIYLTPKGLVKAEEVPDGCGLWEYENGQITITKKAKVNKNVIDFPQSMVKYFAWRAFIAETKLNETP